MDYKKIYQDLVASRKVRGVKKEDGYEVHHIVPRCMGGTNAPSNLVKLTYKEHFIAHRLLTKFVKGIAKGKLKGAVRLMAKDSRRYYSRNYASKESVNSIVNSLYNKCLGGLGDTYMVSIHRKNRPSSIKSFTKNITLALKLPTNSSNLKNMETLLAAIKAANLEGYEQFALSSSGTANWGVYRTLLRLMVKEDFLEEIWLEQRLPVVYKIKDKFLEEGLASSDIKARSPVYSSFTRKSYFETAHVRSKRWFIVKSSSNRYIMYPRNLMDILLVKDCDYVNNLVVKIPRHKMLETLKGLDEYVTGVADNCRIVREK